MDNKETFTYTYSAAQQEEIAAIRKKYAVAEQPPEADKMAQLRRLDARVSRKALTLALTVGIVGALVMGTGMSLVMTDLGALLGMAQPLVPGIVTGILGMAGVIAAYPLHRRTLRRERKKIAPQILQLADELSQN